MGSHQVLPREDGTALFSVSSRSCLGRTARDHETCSGPRRTVEETSPSPSVVGLPPHYSNGRTASTAYGSSEHSDGDGNNTQVRKSCRFFPIPRTNLLARRKSRSSRSVSCPPFSGHCFRPKGRRFAYSPHRLLPDVPRQRVREMTNCPSLSSCSPSLAQGSPPSISFPCFYSSLPGISSQDRKRTLQCHRSCWGAMGRTSAGGRGFPPQSGAVSSSSTMAFPYHGKVLKKRKRVERGQSLGCSVRYPLEHTLQTPHPSKEQTGKWRASTSSSCLSCCSPCQPRVAFAAFFFVRGSGCSQLGETRDYSLFSTRFPPFAVFPAPSFVTVNSDASFSSRWSLPSFCGPVPSMSSFSSPAAALGHALKAGHRQEPSTLQLLRQMGQAPPLVDHSGRASRSYAGRSSAFFVSRRCASLSCCIPPVPLIPFASFRSPCSSGRAVSLPGAQSQPSCSSLHCTSLKPQAQGAFRPLSLLCCLPLTFFSSCSRPDSFLQRKGESAFSGSIPARKIFLESSGFSSSTLRFPSSGTSKLNYKVSPCRSFASPTRPLGKVLPVNHKARAPGCLQAKHLSLSFPASLSPSFRRLMGWSPSPRRISGVFPLSAASMYLPSPVHAFALTTRSILPLSWSGMQRHARACIPPHCGASPRYSSATFGVHGYSNSGNTSGGSIMRVLPRRRTELLNDSHLACSPCNAAIVIPPAVVLNSGARTVVTRPHRYSEGDSWRHSLVSSRLEAFSQDPDDDSEEEQAHEEPEQQAGMVLDFRSRAKQRVRCTTEEHEGGEAGPGTPGKGHTGQKKFREARSFAVRGVLQYEVCSGKHSCSQNVGTKAKKKSAEEDEEEGFPLLDACATLKEADSGSGARGIRNLDCVRRPFPLFPNSESSSNHRVLFPPYSPAETSGEQDFDEQSITDSAVSPGSSHASSEAAPRRPPCPPSAVPPSSAVVSTSWETCESGGTSTVLSALSAEMTCLEKAMLPGVEQAGAMKTFLSQLQDLLSGGVLEACVVTPFGSAVNGLWTPQSDLDVCVQVKGAYTRAQQIKVLRQIAHALHPVESHIIEPRFQARVPIIHWAPRFQTTFGNTCGSILDSQVSGEERAPRALGNCPERNYVGRDGRKQCIAGGGETRPRRVGQPNWVACDISVNNLLAVVNSKLLGAYVQTDTRLRTLGYSVKWWAKGRNINDRARGTVSSFSLILMLIHFLQRHVDPPVLPSLQDIAIHGQAPPVYIGGVDCRYTADRTAIDRELAFLRNGRSPNSQNPGGLLLQFFRYYGYEYKGGVIAIRDTSYFTRQSHPFNTRFLFPGEKKQAARGGGSSRWTSEENARVFGSLSEIDCSKPSADSLTSADTSSSGADYLVVDNPFEVGKDVCNVLPCQYQRIRNEFKRAFRMLSEGSTLRQVAAPDGRSALR